MINIISDVDKHYFREQFYETKSVSKVSQGENTFWGLKRGDDRMNTARPSF